MNTYLKKDYEVFQVRDEKVKISSMFRFDYGTNEKVFDEKLDNIAINKAFDVYRKHNNILNKKEIKNIRVSCNLSQRNFAKMIGWDEATIIRYEQGALPSKANNEIFIGLRDNVDMNFE